MFQKIKFTHDISLVIYEDYNPDSLDEERTVNENFLKGEELSWHVISKPLLPQIDVQFEDGGVIFGVPRNMFEVLEQSE